MLLLRTPIQFVMRFLLGMAEGCFVPGMVFYLMSGFPAQACGRAIGRFYVVLPLSSVVMAGGLLGLNGTLGLSGWKNLLLAEDLPAIALGVAIPVLLPESPAKWAWLSDLEKAWITDHQADRAVAGAAVDPGVGRALADGRLWLLGLSKVCILRSLRVQSVGAHDRGRSDPHGADRGRLPRRGVAPAAAMVRLAGWHSDRRRERHPHVAAFTLVAGAGFLALGLLNAVWILVDGYAATVIAAAIQAVFWLIPSDAPHGRSAAVGLAAIGSIGMTGLFLGPWDLGPGARPYGRRPGWPVDARQRLPDRRSAAARGPASRPPGPARNRPCPRGHPLD